MAQEEARDDVGSRNASVHDLLKRLQAGLEECRSEHRELRARVGALEGTGQAPQPRPSQHAASMDSLAFSEEVSFSLTDTRVDAASSLIATQAEVCREVRQLTERVRQAEGDLGRLQEQQAGRAGAQDGPVAMRLQAMELELAACLRPGDLQGQRQELQEMKTRLAETQLPEAVKVLGQELRVELQARAEGLREDLQAVSSSVTSRLRQLDEQLATIEDRELRAALVGNDRSRLSPDQEDEETGAAGGALLRCQKLAEEARRAALAATERVGRLGEELLGQRPHEDSDEEEAIEALAAIETIAPLPLRTSTPPIFAGAGRPPGGFSPSKRPASAELQQRVSQLERRVARQESHSEVGSQRGDGSPTRSSRRPRSAPAPDPSTWAAVEHLGQELRELWGGRLEALEAQVRAVEGRLEDSCMSKESSLMRSVELGANSIISGTAAASSPPALRAPGGRLGAAEAELRELRQAVEELQARGAAPTGSPLGRTEMGEAVAALAASAELLEQQLEEEGEQAEPAPSPALMRLEGRVEALAEELEAARQRQVEAAMEGHVATEARLRELEEGLGAMKARPIEEELDRRSEARLSAAWQELTKHAEAAAARADQLEQSLVSRLEKLEANSAQLLRRSCPSSATSKMAVPGGELSKDLEALQWRVSWLEWATKGEKRSFGRPLDAKAVLPAPLPGAASAPSLGAPMTEDGELWAREQGGRLRPRRRIAAPGSAASSDTAATLASPEHLGPLRPSRSHGRIPARMA